MSDVIDKLDPAWISQQLKACRLGRGMTQADAAKSMGMARTTLVAIEKGDRRITSRELVSFADLYEKSLSDWLNMKPDAEPLVPQFRSSGREMPYSKVIVQAVSELESLSRDYLKLEDMTGAQKSRDYPAAYLHRGPGITADRRGEEIAAQERQRYSLGENPIQNLRALLEDIGIRIFYLDLPSSLGGIYAYTDELSACIAINRNHPPTRANWSLAHEYGHFLSTRDSADVTFWDHSHWGKAYDEKFADSFAKNFLMPRDGVNSGLSDLVASHGKGVTVADVLTLSYRYRVSAEAMFRRLEELKRLPFGTWERLKGQKFKADQAKGTLGLISEEGREPTLPFRYLMLAKEAFDSQNSKMTEANLSQFLRQDLVGAREELDRLRLVADKIEGDGYSPVNLDSSQILQ